MQNKHAFENKINIQGLKDAVPRKGLPVWTSQITKYQSYLLRVMFVHLMFAHMHRCLHASISISQKQNSV